MGAVEQQCCLPVTPHLVLEWANEHREELMEDWNLCRAKQLPKQIKPLE